MKKVEVRDGVGIARPNGTQCQALGEAYLLLFVFVFWKSEIRGRSVGNDIVKAY